MADRVACPHGLWPSPITASSLSGDIRFGGVGWSDDERLVWREERSGHGVLVVGEADGAPRDLDRDIGVRARVGYGGGDFCVAGTDLYFVGQSDGRLYRQSLQTGRPRPLTPAFGQAASPVVSPDGRWLAYVHHLDGDDRLAVVDTAGRRWPQILAQGRDFYMQPRWSPNGRHLAWVAWDHPDMPWDGAGLWVAEVVRPDGGRAPQLDKARRLAGGDDVAVFQPEFAPDGNAVYFVSDASGFGQLWTVDLTGGEPRRVTSDEADHGQPAWAQDMRTFALGPDGTWAIAVRGEGGYRRLAKIALTTGARSAVPGADSYTEVDGLSISPTATKLAAVVSAPDVPPRVVSIDLASGATRVYARSSTEVVPREGLAWPEAVTWPTGDGETAHGLFYAPASEAYEASGLPPLVVLVHGGPTSQARARWDPAAQFLATRGYAVLQLNYRGSTGFGREYMLRLRRSWGVTDVEDAVSAVRHLSSSGRVDGARSAIMGGSAGGYTVLQTMVRHPEVFSAGVSMYGVADLFHLARDTHKFELHYLDSLVGPLPRAAEAYRERSPVRHADRIQRPLAVFQGADDAVVPRAQSDRIVEALRRNGVPHVYHVYEGEGHGWRRAETIAHFWREVEAFLLEHVVFA